MEAAPQAIIKDVIAMLHRDVLKPLKFKKSGNTWIREDDWPKLVNVQLSKSNTSDEARFTFNLGVFIQALHDAAGAYPVSGSPKERDCDVRTRIGMLLPSGTDKWWNVSRSSNTHELFDAVRADLIETGIPWLDSLKDYPVVAAELARQKNPFMSAIALKLDGRVDAAAQAMKAAHAKANKLALPKLRRIANAQGIPIKG